MTLLFALLRILFYLSLKLVHGLYAMQFIMLLYYMSWCIFCHLCVFIDRRSVLSHK